jgi:hypothetical protein
LEKLKAFSEGVGKDVLPTLQLGQKEATIALLQGSGLVGLCSRVDVRLCFVAPDTAHQAYLLRVIDKQDGSVYFVEAVSQTVTQDYAEMCAVLKKMSHRRTDWGNLITLHAHTPSADYVALANLPVVSRFNEMTAGAGALDLWQCGITADGKQEFVGVTCIKRAPALPEATSAAAAAQPARELPEASSSAKQPKDRAKAKVSKPAVKRGFLNRRCKKQPQTASAATAASASASSASRLKSKQTGKPKKPAVKKGFLLRLGAKGKVTSKRREEALQEQAGKRQVDRHTSR